MNNSITSFNDCKLFHYVVYQFIQPICILLNICVVSTFPNYISMHICLVAKSCPTFCDPMDCSPSGSSVHGVLQARIPEWVAISFPRGSSWPRDWTYVSCIGRWVLYHWATRDARKRYIDVLWKVAKARKAWTRQKKGGGPGSWQHSVKKRLQAYLN